MGNSIDLCLCGFREFFSNRYTLYSFSPILTKFGIGLHDLCANTKKNRGTDF